MKAIRWRVSVSCGWLENSRHFQNNVDLRAFHLRRSIPVSTFYFRVSLLTGNNIFVYDAVFVYSCPSYKMAVKDRMIYSTAKSPLLAQIEGEIGIVIAKKVPSHFLV